MLSFGFSSFHLSAIFSRKTILSGSSSKAASANSNTPLSSETSQTNQNHSGLPLKWLLPLLSSIIAVSPLAIDMYLPAMPILASELNTNIVSVQNSLSIYLFAYALGLIFFGPQADKRSRRAMVFLGLGGFTIASLLLPFAQTIEQFHGLRFLQAFISSAATVVVPGTIRELYGKNTAKGLSYVSMIMMLAPMLAPTLGSGLMLIDSWQLIFYALSAYAALVLLLTIKYLPESAKFVASKQLAQAQLAEQGQDNNLLKNTEFGFIARYKLVLTNSAARYDLLSSMVVSLAFFSYITAVPFVFLTVYQTSEMEFSVLFALNVAGLMTAHFINTRFVVNHGSRKMLSYGLAVALVFSILLVLANSMVQSLMFTVLFLLPLMGSLSMIAVNADALVLTKFSEHSGTATAVIGTLRFGIGALAGPIMAFFYTGDALPFAMLMCVSIIVVAISQYFARQLNKERQES